MEQPIWNFEQDPTNEPMDETSVNLRAYFDRVDDAKLQQYQPTWTDEEVMEWDSNFKDDGSLFILCCERDVEMAEYRRVLDQALAYRNRVRPSLVASKVS